MIRLMAAMCILITTLLQAAEPPAARVSSVSDAYHGVTVEDPYRWLEDAWIFGAVGTLYPRLGVDDREVF